MALRTVELLDEAPSSGYPYGLAAVRALPLELTRPVAILVGDNGSGKSTLIEAIAVAAGFNPEGGSGQVRFETEASHSTLANHLRLTWGSRLQPGWFLRAETFYNVATFRDRSAGFNPLPSYHEISHGESFLTVAAEWFNSPKLFVLDEPEAALSFWGQLALMAAIAEGVKAGAQFIFATHSPILMATPDAEILELSSSGLETTSYDDLEIVGLWRSFLEAPQRFLRYLDDET
ncbi:MAG: AAA family ATPase [Actinomycetota bacterium]